MSSFIQDTRSPAGWGGWCASGLVALSLGGLAIAWNSPRDDDSEDVVIPRAPALTARSLERAPLVQIRRIGAEMDHPNCLESHDPRIPCAMYAPGYRPKSATEDYLPKSTSGNDLSANFVVRDPNWKWPQPGGKGTTLTVTYSYSNLLDGGMRGVTAAQLRAGVTEALRIWSAVSPLTFREVTDSGPTPSDSSYTPGSAPNLRFGHHAIDGALGVLAHAFYPYDVTGDGLSGDLHFDEGEIWVVRPSGNRVDFIEVAVHELGHALGLAHSATTQAIMYPFYGARYSGPGTAFILPDDRDGIQAIYGPKPTTTPNVPEPPTPPPTPTPNANVITIAYNTTTKTLTLTGDGSANSMTLVKTGTNLVATAGTGTTLVYLGQKKSSVIFPNITGKIQVAGTLGSGSDTFTGTSLDVDTFQLDLSGGNDSVTLNLCSVTKLNLNGGSGTDTYIGTTSRVTTNTSTGFP